MARGAKQQLTGKIVAITGGARGIGLATAREFLRHGAKVAIGDIDDQLVQASAAELGIVGIKVDITDASSFAAFLDAVEQQVGPLDILVNNAGIMPLGPFAEEPQDVTRRIVEINLLGTATGVKLAMQRFVPRGRGHIINVASTVGRIALKHAATYSASKFAVVGLTEAVRWELRDTGVEASVILPQIVRTELAAGLDDQKGKLSVSPEDVATAIREVAQQPVFERWVPAKTQKQWKFLGLLSRGAYESSLIKSGAYEVLATSDASARAAYESRARG
jgi:NAD(P)-dependent dehydrogenase (short-subunit alcohol dehydrogenase family)